VRLERANGAAGGDVQPRRFRLRGGDAGEQPDVRPRDLARDERRTETRQPIEPRRAAGEALHLAPGEAEPLAGPVADAREAAGLDAAHAEKGAREAAEDEAEQRFAAREPAQPVVEDETGVGIEVGIGVGRREESGGDHRIWGRRRLDENDPDVKCRSHAVPRRAERARTHRRVDRVGPGR